MPPLESSRPAAAENRCLKSHRQSLSECAPHVYATDLC